MAASYIANGLAVTFAANKSMMTLFNGSGSGVVLRLYRIWITNAQTSNVTGVITDLYLYKVTASSSGSTITPVKYDTSSPALPGQVGIRTNGTDTLGSEYYRKIFFSTDEYAVGDTTIDGVETFHAIMNVWDCGYGDSRLEPITLREGEGITVRNITATTGSADFGFEFTSGAS